MKKINTIVFVSILMTLTIIATTNIAALDTTTPIPLSTVSLHNTLTNCWSAIDGKVYDLTSYISSHPGGSAIAVICGIDGTQIFLGKHPSSYLNIISSYQIGVLATPDTTAPVITILGSNPKSINVGDSYVDSGAKATDNVDGNITSSIITVNSVNSLIAGTYSVKYTVKDAAGNSATASRTVIVNAITPPIDTTAPVITILGSNPKSINVGDSYVDSGAKATDNIDGNITSSIITVNGVDTSLAGTYLVKYLVNDAAGNSASKSRTVIVNAVNNTQVNDSKNEDKEDDDKNEVKGDKDKKSDDKEDKDKKSDYKKNNFKPKKVKHLNQKHYKAVKHQED